MRFFRRKPQKKETPSPANRWSFIRWRWPFFRKNIPHEEETPSPPSHSRFRLPFKRKPTPSTTTVSKPSSPEKPKKEAEEETNDKPSKKARLAILGAVLVLLKKLFSRKKKEETPPVTSVERSRLSKLVGILGQLLLLGLLGLGVQYVDIEQGFQQYITPLLRPSQEMLLQENQRLATANREMYLNQAQMTSTAIYATAVMVNVETAVARANQQATARVADMISQETAQARETQQASNAGRTATAVLLNGTVTAAAVQRAATATTEQEFLALSANVRTATSNAQEKAVTVAAVVRTATVQAVGIPKSARTGSGCTSAAMLFGLTVCLGVFQRHQNRDSQNIAENS